jgi:hypothetical protein
VLSGRAPTPAPKLRSHPDFPLRNFVRCEACGRGLTGSWSKGRSDCYACYHCRPGCRGVNVTKAKLETLFTDELARLQPTPGYMRPGTVSAMNAANVVERVPIHTDAQGVVRVARTRVSLPRVQAPFRSHRRAPGRVGSTSEN